LQKRRKTTRQQISQVSWALYTTLFAKLKQQAIHTIIGGITLPNSASIALHEKFGLHQVAHFKQVGFKFGRWLDVGYWQINIDSSSH